MSDGILQRRSGFQGFVREVYGVVEERFGALGERAYAGVVAECLAVFERGGSFGEKFEVEAGRECRRYECVRGLVRVGVGELGVTSVGRGERVDGCDSVEFGGSAGCGVVGGEEVVGDVGDSKLGSVEDQFLGGTDEIWGEREGMRVVLGGVLDDELEVREVDMATGKVIEDASGEKKKKKYKSTGREDAMKAVLAGERDVSTLTGAQRRKVEKKLLDRAQKAAALAGVVAEKVDDDVEKVGVVGGGEESVPEWRRSAGAFPVRSARVDKEKSLDPLRESLERKWMAKNALEAKKAERELALLNGEDIEAVKGLREKKLRAATEKAMVQTERAHAVLAATGNVPGVQPGFCETVVDGEVVSGSATRVCSISPGSSISEKEVRQMQKANADQEKKIAELEARNADLSNALGLYKRGEKVDEQVERMYCESVPVTVDSEGEVPADVMWKAGNKYEGKEFMEVGPLVNGKRTVKFDRYGFSRSGAYSKDYEAFDTY